MLEKLAYDRSEERGGGGSGYDSLGNLLLSVILTFLIKYLELQAAAEAIKVHCFYLFPSKRPFLVETLFKNSHPYLEERFFAQLIMKQVIFSPNIRKLFPKDVFLVFARKNTGGQYSLEAMRTARKCCQNWWLLFLFMQKSLDMVFV